MRKSILRRLEEKLKPQMSELQFFKTLVKNAGSYLKFFFVFIFKGITILFIKHAKIKDGNVESCRLTHDTHVKIYVRK